jgi:hypothetical protein
LGKVKEVIVERPGQAILAALDDGIGKRGVFLHIIAPGFGVKPIFPLTSQGSN